MKKLVDSAPVTGSEVEMNLVSGTADRKLKIVTSGHVFSCLRTLGRDTLVITW